MLPSIINEPLAGYLFVIESGFWSAAGEIRKWLTNCLFAIFLFTSVSRMCEINERNVPWLTQGPKRRLMSFSSLTKMFHLLCGLLRPKFTCFDPLRYIFLVMNLFQQVYYCSAGFGLHYDFSQCLGFFTAGNGINKDLNLWYGPMEPTLGRPNSLLWRSIAVYCS